MKRTSLVVLLSMVLGLLAACGSSGTGAGSTGTASSGAASATASLAASTEASMAASTEASAMASAGGSAAASTEASMGASSEASVAGSAAASSAGGPMPDLKGRKVLIGTDATYPPMESVDQASNKIVGFDVDLMNEMAKLINIKPEFQNANFDTIFQALQSKQFDAVMSSVTITDERKKIIAFTDPYVTVGQVILVQSNNDKIKGPEDLANGPTVGAQTGTTGETAALNKAKVPDNKLKRYQTIDLAVADLANSTIDAVVVDSVPAANYVAQPQYKDKVKIVGAPFTTEEYGIAVNQSDTELLNAFNAALNQLKSQGTIDQLKQKYQIK